MQSSSSNMELKVSCFITASNLGLSTLPSSSPVQPYNHNHHSPTSSPPAYTQSQRWQRKVPHSFTSFSPTHHACLHLPVPPTLSNCRLQSKHSTSPPKKGNTKTQVLTQLTLTAKSRTIAVRLISMAMTGYYRTFVRPRAHRPLSMMKYDPVGMLSVFFLGREMLCGVGEDEEEEVVRFGGCEWRSGARRRGGGG